MLQVTNTGSLLNEALEFNEYVPFSLEFENPSPMPLYWRGKDGDSGLVEIGIHPDSGFLQSVTLTTLPNSSVVKPPSWFPGANISSGIPKCNLNAYASSREFADRFVDEDISLRICFSENQACLMFGIENPPIRFVRSGRAQFGLDASSYLVAVTLMELSAEEMRVLRSALV